MRILGLICTALAVLLSPASVSGVVPDSDAPWLWLVANPVSLSDLHLPPGFISVLQFDSKATSGQRAPAIVATDATGPSANASDEGDRSLAMMAPQEQLLWIEEGQLISLERQSPQTLPLGDKMEFLATLTNHTQGGLKLVAEVIVIKGDGSQETLIPSYPVQLGRGKEFRVPFAMAAKGTRFAPGVTQFIAFLRDAQGDLVDRASITFMLTLPLH